jgi:hypothetical protein
MRVFTQDDELFRECRGLMDQPVPTPADLARLQRAIARLHDAIEAYNGHRYPYHSLCGPSRTLAVTHSGQSFSSIDSGAEVLTLTGMRNVLGTRSLGGVYLGRGPLWIMQQDDGYSPPFQLYST